MLPQYEKYNRPYRNVYGTKIQDMIPFFINDCGWNMFRVRIFVNPKQKAKGETDYAVCQDLTYGMSGLDVRNGIG